MARYLLVSERVWEPVQQAGLLFPALLVVNLTCKGWAISPAWAFFFLMFCFGRLVGVFEIRSHCTLCITQVGLKLWSILPLLHELLTLQVCPPWRQFNHFFLFSTPATKWCVRCNMQIKFLWEIWCKTCSRKKMQKYAPGLILWDFLWLVTCIY